MMDNSLAAITPHPSVTNHHVKVVQCDEAGFQSFNGELGSPWDCSESDTPPVTGLRRADTCARGHNEMYSWVPGTDPLTLPPGVGMSVKGESNKEAILILQVHYAHFADHPEKEKVSDGTEGITIRFVSQSSGLVSHMSAALRFGAHGVIRANGVTKAEVACRMNETIALHPIAFLVHAHHLSTVVSGWLVTADGRWRVIGKADPKTHASRYPIPDKDLVINQGDVIAARCTYNNTSERDVPLGFVI